MPRPKIKRSVQHPPLFSDFKPAGIRAGELQPLELALDELKVKADEVLLAIEGLS